MQAKTLKKNLHLLQNLMPIILYKGAAQSPFKVTWMSDDVEESTGFSYNTFKYDPEFWASRVHPDDKDDAFAVFGKLSTGEEESVKVRYRWLHKDGMYRWFLDHAIVVKDEKGKAIEILGAWVDVSTHAKAEETIEENEELYRKLIQLNPYAIQIKSGGNFVFVNQATMKLLEATSLDEVVGKPLRHFIHPDYHEQLLKDIRTVEEEHKEVPLSEYKVLTLKGNIKTVEMTATPFTYEGKSAAQNVMIDISRHKQAEDMLRAQREDLEQLNRILMRRELSEERAAPGTCTTSFDPEKGILLIGDKEVRVQKYSKQYYLLNILFQDFDCTSKDWQLSEISELMDMEARFEWKKLYNIADAIRKNVAIATGIRDFFILTTQSIKINPKYLSQS